MRRTTPFLPQTLLILVCVALGCASLPLSTNAAVHRIDWSGLDSTLESLTTDSNFLVAEFSGNSCTTIHQRNADLSLAVASTFKIYVLGALGLAVMNGSASWDDTIELQLGLRSMPSGDFAYREPGTRVSVRDLAEAMIWNSDNTATDHLISYLGRDAVERAFAAFGHSNPELNTPLLLTKELFAIKMTQSDAWMETFAAADDDSRLHMLYDDIDPIVIDPSGGWGKWNGPTWIDQIEWFASANDLCRASVRIWTLGAQPGLEPLREIMSGNRGAIGSLSSFPHAGYKGGYEAGVVNMTYLLEREDGRVFFVSAGYNSTRYTVDTGTAVSYITPVFQCLANNECIGG